MNEENRGSLFASWNEDLRKRYIRVLDMIIESLRSTPYYFFTITDIDKLKLREAAMALGVDIEEYDLDDQSDFFRARGLLIKMAVKKVEEQLRPSNVLDEMLVKVPEGFEDLSPEILKKKLLGDGNDSS